MVLTVGPDCLGTPEAVWLGSGWFERLPEWALPATEAIVVVAPHPDDETLGTGGLLQRFHRLGAAIEVVAVTDGEASHGEATVAPGGLADRRAEERDVALCRLGLADANVTTLHLADGHVSDSVDGLAQAIAAQLRPGAVCLAPWRHDGHPDHDACGQAAAAATAGVGARLVEYLVWAWHWATPEGGELPVGSARRVDLAPSELALKGWAIEAFASQLTSWGRAPADGPVLPAPIVRRFRRPHEVVLV